MPRLNEVGGVITSATVIISADTLPVLGTTLGSWSFFAYMHEIGHSLGLGHTKPESAAKGFGNGTLFLIDSFQASMMSGFFASYNTYINDSAAHPVTPMIADIIAIQNLYGVPEDSNGGDTIYGYQSNVDGYLGEFFRLWTGETDPFILVDVPDAPLLALHTLASADLDGDGDPDMVIANHRGDFHYFENTGTATNPAFTLRTGISNPLDTLVANFDSTPTFTDLDGDGDLDLVNGSKDGAIAYIENTGSTTAPVFARRSGADNPFNGIDTGVSSTPALADLDGDGDIDLIAGNIDGELAYFENTGTASAPAFTERTGAVNPLDGVSTNLHSAPELSDLDGDGDFDLILWGWYGRVDYYENTGTATNPTFEGRSDAADPFSTINLSNHGNPAFTDLDGDGDFDLVARDLYGVKFRYFENVGTDAEPDFMLPEQLGGPAALTLYDTAGTDTLDLRTDRVDQRVDLRPEGISDVYGLTGTLVIARGVLIENFIAGFGNDVVVGNSAVNRLEGRAGDDVLEGGAGADTLDGGPGNDTAAYTDSDTGVTVRLSTGAGLKGHAEGDTLAGIENLTGSAHRDALGGDRNDNILNGGPGNDGIWGGSGDDTLIGGPGADRIKGDRGMDTADYTDSNTGVTVRLSTGAGLKGHAEGDTLAGIENLTGSAHRDALGGDRNDNILNGGPGNDGIWGGSGDDTLIGGPGADRIKGDRGMDTADYTDSNTGVTVRLHSLSAAGGDADGDTFPGLVDVNYTDSDGVEQTERLPDIENLTGSAHNDVLAGDRRDNVLDGGAGDDTLYGGPGGGDDVQVGNEGDDRLYGGKGNDRLEGGSGNDRLAGGPGADIFVFAPGHGADTITDFTNTEDQIDLTAFDLSGFDVLTITSSTTGITIGLSTHDGGTILLEGVAMTSLDAADFLF